MEIAAIYHGNYQYQFLCDLNEIFHKSLVTGLDKMLTLNVKRQLLWIRTEEEFNGDISTIISINDANMESSMSISFPKETYLYLVNKLLGFLHNDIDDQNQDVAIDICSEVYKESIPKLAKIGITPAVTYPMVIIGSNHRVKYTVKERIIVSEYESMFGNFKMEVVGRLRQNKQ